MHAPAEVVCRVANVSRTGALAISTDPVTELSQVAVKLVIEDATGGPGETFNCEAAVVRCTPRPGGDYDLGLFFTSMTEVDRRTLDRILDTRSVVHLK